MITNENYEVDSDIRSNCINMGFARQQYFTCTEKELFIKVAHSTHMYMLRMNHTVVITASNVAVEIA